MDLGRIWKVNVDKELKKTKQKKQTKKNKQQQQNKTKKKKKKKKKKTYWYTELFDRDFCWMYLFPVVFKF